jgi:hypothetical protein
VCASLATRVHRDENSMRTPISEFPSGQLPLCAHENDCTEEARIKLDVLHEMGKDSGVFY